MMMESRINMTAKVEIGHTPIAVNPATNQMSLPEIRCPRCRRLLMKGEVKRIEIKCPKCGYYASIS